MSELQVLQREFMYTVDYDIPSSCVRLSATDWSNLVREVHAAEDVVLEAENICNIFPELRKAVLKYRKARESYTETQNRFSDTMSLHEPG